MKHFKQFLKENLVMIKGGFVMSRHDMPQIDNPNDFVNWLISKEINSTHIENFPVDLIKPLQVQIDDNKVQSIDPEKNPIIFISEDYFILDGHHRYYSRLINGYETISTHMVGLPINQLLVKANEYLEEQNE